MDRAGHGRGLCDDTPCRQSNIYQSPAFGQKRSGRAAEAEHAVEPKRGARAGVSAHFSPPASPSGRPARWAPNAPCIPSPWSIWGPADEVRAPTELLAPPRPVCVRAVGPICTLHASIGGSRVPSRERGSAPGVPWRCGPGHRCGGAHFHPGSCPEGAFGAQPGEGRVSVWPCGVFGPRLAAGWGPCAPWVVHGGDIWGPAASAGRGDGPAVRRGASTGRPRVRWDPFAPWILGQGGIWGSAGRGHRGPLSAAARSAAAAFSARRRARASVLGA